MQFIGRHSQLISALLVGPLGFLLAHTSAHGAVLAGFMGAVENWGG